MKKLTIGMATYDDYDGVYFTIQSLRMYHDICNTDEVEFVVIDNNPTSKYGEETKKFVERIHGKYFTNENKNTSFSKYKIADLASGEYVLILDCHVLLSLGSINCLLSHYEKSPDCKDLIQGPLLYDDLKTVSTHFDPKWSGHMYGVWATNKEAYEKNEPFEIPMQGMGLLSFEKKNWPRINNNFIGFGGEEGYIAEKFKQNGGKNICLPGLKWSHRFGRPAGVPYRLILEDRIYNYFLGWMEIDPQHEMVKSIYDYFITHVSEDVVKRSKIAAEKCLEITK